MKAYAIEASVVIAGGIRSSADVFKAIALGADAVYIGNCSFDSYGLHSLPTLLHRQMPMGYRDK